ncbi:hypothetical protein [Streptomyces sp. NPDC086777]|uniref:hypothetical protein n=1 Tax=Streptomyces sp. NPDC086777 TaxID=3154866 RepID=UPI003450251E
MKLAEYGEANMDLALRGLEPKTPDPYLSGWRIRVVPALGHLGSARRGPRRIAGHGSLTTTQRYLHPDVHKITAAGAALSAHLSVLRAPRSLPSPIVVTR